jgi:hypothetical protein
LVKPLTLVPRLKGDERGAVLAQALLILPILIVVVFGGYTIWKVAYVRQSLRSGTYQATRYLCLNPVDHPVRGDQKEWEKAWADVVKAIVACEVENNGLADDYKLVATVNLPETKLECSLSFTVVTTITFQIDIPYLDLDEVTLRDRHEGWVECR